ncbi:outer membrane protein [Ruegeria arenilitoris]|uniref:outer membrane protein n=1 Tax=Ruegeria arenilitoris TaxID=1173585 RepID=UPI00147A1C73|nr:outer membrane beta-barrel protein [Ruegeria arenilitoris]
MKAVALVSLLPLAQFMPNLAHAQSTATDSAFDGAYVGLELGAATSDGTTDYPVLSGGNVNATFDPDNGRSFGGLVGYNMQRGDWIYSAEFRYSNMSHVLQNDAPDPERREVLDFSDLRGRVGYVTGDFMFYGALGWSWSRFRVHPSRTFKPRDSQTTLNGFNIGLGMEYNVSDKWLVGADYTYRDLSGRFDDASSDSDIDLSTITARVAYRF